MKTAARCQVMSDLEVITHFALTVDVSHRFVEFFNVILNSPFVRRSITGTESTSNKTKL